MREKEREQAAKEKNKATKLAEKKQARASAKEAQQVAEAGLSRKERKVRAKQRALARKQAAAAKEQARITKATAKAAQVAANQQRRLEKQRERDSTEREKNAREVSALQGEHRAQFAPDDEVVYGALATDVARLAFFKEWQKNRRFWTKLLLFAKEQLVLYPELASKFEVARATRQLKAAQRVKSQFGRWEKKRVLAAMSAEESEEYEACSGRTAKTRYYRAMAARYPHPKLPSAKRKAPSEEAKGGPGRSAKRHKHVKCKDTVDLYTERVRTLPDVVKEFDGAPKHVEPCSLRVRTVTLNPTAAQRAMLRGYMGSYRATYNACVAADNDGELAQRLHNVDTLPDSELRTYVLQTLPAQDPSKAFLQDVPYNFRELASREYTKAKAANLKAKGPEGFTMRFKSLRHSNRQTVPLGKRAVRLQADGSGVYVFCSENPEPIAFQAKPVGVLRELAAVFAQSTQRKKATAGSAERAASPARLEPPKDCKLTYDRSSRRYTLTLPATFQREWSDLPLTSGDSQAEHKNDAPCADAAPSGPRVIALDPGVRTFMTGYTPTGELFESGKAADMSKLCKLAHRLDRLHAAIVAQHADTVLHGRKRSTRLQNLRRARLRVYRRIRNLVDEVHWKTASYLARNFDVILLPEFATQQMIRKYGDDGAWRGRKINRSTARRMVMWSHYRFRQRLREKVKQHGGVLAVVNEAYTSKTCTRCGHLHQKLGGNRMFKCPRCAFVTGRDVNGARNILLRNACPPARQSLPSAGVIG